MRFTAGLVALAAIAGVSAQDVSGTTTLTSTMTKTLTITECNPTVTNCPLRSSTTSASSSIITSSAANSTTSATSTPHWSVSNSTISVGPTAPTTIISTSAPGVPTTIVDTPAPTAAPTAGAVSLMANTGLVAAALAAFAFF